MRAPRFVITLPATFVLLAVACSAPPPSGSDTKDVLAADKPATDPAGGSDGSDGSEGGTTKIQGTGVCAGKANADACFSCCEAATPEIAAAVKAYDAMTKQWQTCACAADKCGSACATDYCKPGHDPEEDAAEGSACEACLDEKTDACDAEEEATEAELEKTPGYAAWDQCDEDAKCEEMEDAEEGDDD